MGALKPNPMTHPNLFAWAAIVSKFKESTMAKWKAGELPRTSTTERRTLVMFYGMLNLSQLIKKHKNKNLFPIEGLDDNN